MLRLKTFGQPMIERDGEALGGAARQRRVVALLTAIASGRTRGISRDRLLGLLWSERESEKARQALTQSLYHARKALSQDDVFFADADLRLNPDVITTDIDEFEAALEREDPACAAALYQGPFLDGFHLNDAPEFERWASDQRNRFHARSTKALEDLAIAANAASDFRGAAEWWKRLAVLEPLNSRIALELMHAMAGAGDRAGAIRYSQIHQSLLREELDAAPNPAIVALAERLKASPTWTPGTRSSPAKDAFDIEGPVHPPTESATPDPRSERPEKRWLRGPRGIGLVLASVALTGAVIIGAASLLSRRQSAPATNLVVVAPFRVSGADPALAYLREGLIDLFVTTLSDEPSGVADPGAVLTAWRRAAYTDRVELSRDEAVTAARQLGATRLVLGSVVGAPSRLVVNAAVLGLPDGRVRAQASADGPADSLTTIVDRLVARLLAKEAGEWDRLASHTSSSAQALRAYLDGQAAYRRGSYRDAVRSFRRALERDGSFAMAGLALANAADRIDAAEDQARGLAAAWTSRSDLTERDSIYLHALAGPRYPAESSPREYLLAWEQAAALVGDRADVWHELGERLFHDGQALGIRDWSARATAAFRRAAALDPAFASPLQYLVQLAARSDTLGLRASASGYLRLDSIGELSPFVRWRAAVALGDTRALAALRRQLASIPAASLRSIVLSSQYNAVAPGDAERALSALISRAARGAERADALLARHALALNRGAVADAADAIERLSDDRTHLTLTLRLQVTDYLYGSGDSTAAANAVARLVRRLAADSAGMYGSPSSPPTSDALHNACVTAQWRAWIEPVTAIDTTQSLFLRETVAGGWQPGGLCSAMIAAILARRSGAQSTAPPVARLDSLLLVGVPDEELREYTGLALSRMYTALGDKRRALDAIRRRPFMRRWPHYLASALREEGALAAAMNDSAGAIAAYRLFLNLRSTPQGVTNADVDGVRAELSRLEQRIATK